MFKRFVTYYKPHLKLFTADMISSVLISLLGMVYPVMTNRMLNDFIPNRAYQVIIVSGLCVLALYAVRMLLRYFVQFQGHMVGTRMQAQMRRELFAHLERLPYSFFDDHETGKIMTRMTNDLFEVSELAHHGLENLLTCSIMIVLSFVYCFADDFYTVMYDSLKKQAIFSEINAFLDERKFNARDLLEDVLEKTRIEMDQSEKNRFYDKHLKNMTLSVSKDGTATVEIKK